jgi:hypothetical protein
MKADVGIIVIGFLRISYLYLKLHIIVFFDT